MSIEEKAQKIRVWLATHPETGKQQLAQMAKLNKSYISMAVNPLFLHGICDKVLKAIEERGEE